MIKLALVGRPHPEGLRGANLSAQVIYELLRERLARHSDVDLVEVRTAAEPVDVEAVLVHDYIDEAHSFLKRTKQRYPHVITASFMEVGYACDRPYVFMPEARVRGDEQVILFPYDEKHLGPTAKLEGSILIDHDWRSAATALDRTAEICDAILPFADDVLVAQCERNFEPRYGQSFEAVPQLPYLRYLSATDRFEYFVVTHKGSYNGAVVDMAARGTKVIAPEGHLTPSQVEFLGVKTFKTVDELCELLRKDWSVSPVVTSYTDAVEMILATL